MCRELSIDEMSQSDESPVIPVPMVIACKANHDDSEAVDITNDISSPSLLFDSNTPVSVLPVTEPQSSISNSEASSMATEQDSVNTIPDTVETLGDGEHVITMVTNSSCPDNEQFSDVDNISVTDSNDAIGGIPNNDDVTTIHPEGDSSSSSVTHLLDHSYATLHDGVGGASSYEKLKCLEKIATMITPVSRRSAVLLKDNGCHAARCSAIKRSNRTLARVRRHQRQVTSLSPNKSPRKKIMKDALILSKHTSLPVKRVEESCSDVTVDTAGVAEAPSAAGSDGDDRLTNMVDSVTQSVDFVVKMMEHPEEAVTESIGAVTQPITAMTQPIATMTQSMVTVTEPVVTVTQSIGTVTQRDKLLETTIVQGGGNKVSCSLAHSNVAILAKPGGTMTYQKDTITQSMDMGTHRTDTVTQSADTATPKPLHTATQHIPSTSSSTGVSNPLQIVSCSQHNNITTPIRLPMLLPNVPSLQQYNHLVKQLAISTISSALHGIHGNNHLSYVSNQSLKGSSSIVAEDTTSKMACLYGMLSSCLVSSEMTIPTTYHPSVSTSPMPHHFVSSSSQILPIIHNVFSNVNTSQFPFSNCQLPTIIRGRQPNLTTPTIKAQVIAPTNSSSSDLTPTRTSISVITVNTPSVTSLASGNSPSISSLTSANSSVVSVNSPSISSLTSANSSVMSLTSVNTPSVTSLTSVNSSVMSLTSVNTPSISLTSVKFPSVTSLSVSSLAKINSPSFQPIQVAKSPNITVSTSVNSSVTPIMSNVSSSTTPIMSNVNSSVTPIMSNVNSSVTPIMSNVNSSVTPIMSNVNSSVTPIMFNDLKSVNSSVTSLTASSLSVSSIVSTHVANSDSNKCSPLTLKQTEDVEMLSTSSIDNSVTSVTIGTVSQATVSENIPSKRPGDNMESPPHTPTGGILKRVSQFDTPTTSGKVSVCLVIFLIINMASEATSIICRYS